MKLKNKMLFCGIPVRNIDVIQKSGLVPFSSFLTAELVLVEDIIFSNYEGITNIGEMLVLMVLTKSLEKGKLKALGENFRYEGTIEPKDLVVINNAAGGVDEERVPLKDFLLTEENYKEWVW